MGIFVVASARAIKTHNVLMRIMFWTERKFNLKKYCSCLYIEILINSHVMIGVNPNRITIWGPNSWIKEVRNNLLCRFFCYIQTDVVFYDFIIKTLKNKYHFNINWFLTMKETNSLKNRFPHKKIFFIIPNSIYISPEALINESLTKIKLKS